MEKLCIKLEELLSDILFCGIKNISPDINEKIHILSKNFSEIGLETGSEMLNNLYNEIISVKQSEKSYENVVLLLCSLECYLKNISK